MYVYMYIYIYIYEISEIDQNPYNREQLESNPGSSHLSPTPNHYTIATLMYIYIYIYHQHIYIYIYIYITMPSATFSTLGCHPGAVRAESRRPHHLHCAGGTLWHRTAARAKMATDLAQRILTCVTVEILCVPETLNQQCIIQEASVWRLTVRSSWTQTSRSRCRRDADTWRRLCTAGQHP